MAIGQYTGIVSSWELPNFVGELYTADTVPGQMEPNPTFLSLIGGLTGGTARLVPDMNFTMTVEFDYPAAVQPEISEAASIVGPPQPINPLYTPSDNTCQIYQESVEESYLSRATRGRLVTPFVYPSDAPGVDNEGWLAEFNPNRDAAALEEQVSYALGRVARNVNYTFLNGVYHKSTSKNDAPKTRGIIPAVTTNAINANGAKLSEKLFSELMIAVVTNTGGRAFQSIPVLLVSASQKRALSELFIFPPESRTVGGKNLQVLETDFGPVYVMYEPTVPDHTVLLASMSLIKPVFNAVPGKGVLFYEDKAKAGASAGGMIYGHIGLDYGPEWMHGKIYGLTV